MNQKKSPLKDKPLRQPGQSVQEELEKVIDDKLLPVAMISVLFISLTFLEWFAYFQQTPRNPIFYTILALLTLCYTTYLFYKQKNTIRNLKQGRDGEKAVGQFLEILREDGCIVFHDIVGDKFNIDHVVISEKGIYCIETKTYSKLSTGNPRVHFNGQTLRVDGLGNKNDILTQVNSASTWLKRTLMESTGKDFVIRPVILFPGWMVNNENNFKDIWVLEPKGFPKFLKNQNDSISREDKKLAAYHLSRYIRTL
jgi:nuclease-like protein